MKNDNLYAYIHGFASGPQSHKGLLLAESFASVGKEMLRPDLNHPSFAELTYTGALTKMDAMDAQHRQDDQRWCLVGSSMGGFLSAYWSSQHPERVERLVLLCPGFDLVRRWPILHGQEKMDQWKRDGALMLPDSKGVQTPVHWGFIEDSLQYPPFPVTPCPTLIIHGTRDEVVPIESSRTYAAQHRHVELLEVDDDHGLVASLPLIWSEIQRFFDLNAPSQP
ncbi:MAG: alpha/beta fold hydrolase [Myxococcales bacterium]|nr:alpha/beta fold hydrolase [Myxococcales bacterium]